jgi:hypothetical protein
MFEITPPTTFKSIFLLAREDSKLSTSELSTFKLIHENSERPSNCDKLTRVKHCRSKRCEVIVVVSCEP